MPINPRGPAGQSVAGPDGVLSRADVLRMIQGVSRSTKQGQPVSAKHQDIEVFNKLTVNGGLNLSDQAAIAASQVALATPVLRGEAGGSLLGGSASGTYLCNMDSTPKVPATLGNQVLSLFRYSTPLDDPPNGYKTQWMVEATYTTNATAVGTNVIFGLIQLTSIGGGAGGYTETISGSFSPTQVQSGTISSVVATEVTSAWLDNSIAGTGSAPITTAQIYSFAVFLGGAFAANSALRWRIRLYRRWVPV